MSEDTVKYRMIFEHLQKELREGRYSDGTALPSEESLVRKFNVSRITARALGEHVKAQGAKKERFLMRPNSSSSAYTSSGSARRSRIDGKPNSFISNDIRKIIKP